MRSSPLLLLLGLAAHAFAHGGDHEDSMGMDMDVDMVPDDKPNETDYPPSYFDFPDDKFLIYAHIALMTLGWVFALPIGMTYPFLSGAP